jgi:ribonuclease Z
MKKHHIATIAVAAVAALALAAYPLENALLRLHAVQAAVIKRGFAQVMRANADMATLVNAPELRVVLCGTASPMPNAEREGPCAAVLAGGKIWLVDAGGGGWRNLMLWHLPVQKLAGVLLTHFHSDHIEDLGEVNLQSWVAGRTAPLAVYGGPGVDQVVNGFQAAYALDTGYRIRHHGEAVLPPAVGDMVPHAIESAPGVALKEGETAPVLDQDGMRITAIGVNHFPVSPAYGYRFTYGGRSVVISGDTRESSLLAQATKGADVLVHEAQSNDAVAQIRDLMAQQGNTRMAKVLGDIQSYHTTPEGAARVANAAGVKLLVLTHLTPALPGLLAQHMFMDPVAAVRSGESVLGHDGLMVSLPSGSDAVDVSDVWR